MSKYEALILKKNPTTICFDKKMVNNEGEGFVLTAKFYNHTNAAAVLAPGKRNPELKATIKPEGMAVKQQEERKTKQ